MEENLNLFLKENNIDLEGFNKMTYSLIKIILLEKKYKIELFEPNIDLGNKKIEIINVESNTINKEIFDRKTAMIYRNYLVRLLNIMKANEIDINEMYQDSKTNNYYRLQEILLKLKVIHSHSNKKENQTNDIDDKLYHQQKDEAENEYYINNIEDEFDDYDDKEEDYRKDPRFRTGRYCSACDNSPCICSDPDPG